MTATWWKATGRLAQFRAWASAPSSRSAAQLWMGKAAPPMTSTWPVSPLGGHTRGLVLLGHDAAPRGEHGGNGIQGCPGRVEVLGEIGGALADHDVKTTQDGRWEGRPVQAALLRLLAVAVPVAAGVLASVVFSHAVEYPHGIAPVLL